MTISYKLIISVLLFIVTLVFGIWLSRNGKPYNSVLFNIHKLIALATILSAVITIRNLLENLSINPIVLIALILLGLFVLILFASGTFLSTVTFPYDLLKKIHIAITLSTTITSILLYYLLKFKN